jgi:hypothetical protein
MKCRESQPLLHGMRLPVGGGNAGKATFRKNSPVFPEYPSGIKFDKYQ